MKTHSAQVIWYGGGDIVAEVPSRNDISECDNGLTAIFQQSLSEKQPIHFMPNDVEDAFEYVNNVQTYILRIHSPLINGQKARVDITGIKPFFDVVIPDNEPLSIFKPRLVKIILGAEKIDKSKRRILREVRRYEIETASDDDTSKHYHRKIAREKKLPLSERAILSGYNYNSDTNSPIPAAQIQNPNAEIPNAEIPNPKSQIIISIFCRNPKSQIPNYNYLSEKQPIHFMPNDVEDAFEYVNNVQTYILRIHSPLINGQKARVDITGIKPFFDVVIPDNEPLSIFKPRLVKIILGAEKIDKSKFGMKVVHAYPIRGYHTQEKNHYDRRRILREVRRYEIETASDDDTSKHYHRKIAREKKLPLSERAILNNYQSLGENKPDDQVITEALSHDRTLVLTCDIETYSARKIGDLPNAKNDENRKDDPKPLKRICLVDVETKPDPSWITIVCGNQTNILKAFALCWKNLTLDIQIGFNDLQYDWPFVIEKAKSLGILEWMFNHMSPDSSNIEEIIKWKYRKSEIKISDEKFYSKYLKIPGCIPIDVRACFKKLYLKSEASSLKYYLDVCGLDNKADIPIHIMNKYYEEAILQLSDVSAKNMHEVANYCIIDALRCQELMVCNLLGAEAWSRNILCSMIPCENPETGKYPGAYVVAPIKGLENKRSVTGLDFASLYPSLIMTYNLSSDKIILSRKEVIDILRAGKKLHKIEFPFNGQTLVAWSVCHNNIPKDKGLYASVLEKLRNKRNEMKERLRELDEKSFKYTCINSKQNAFKIYMNTFYGEAGNNISPFYLLELAGGVTSARQRNIKFIKKFVEGKGFKVKYGDTDSLYLTCPGECFQECDQKYKLGQLSREEYWEEMIKISMEVMKNLRNDVNTELEKDNGTPYLNMAYEEVLFPVRVDVVKRGQSKLFRNVEKLSKLDYDEFIQTCIWRPKKEGKQGNIFVERFVSQMGARYGRKVLENQQLIKKGLPVNSYLYKVPKPVVPEEIYDNCGKKISQKKGDCMEYPDVVKKFNKKINIDYYTEILDRKKKSKEKKLKNVKDLDEDEIANIKDVELQKLAKKWLKNYIKNLCDAGMTRSSGISTRYNDYLNALDRIADSTRSKLSDLLSKLSKLNCEVLIDFQNTWYKVIGLKIARLQALSIMQNSKKDNPLEADINEIVDLYC
ncbi:hypothetical protein Glove_168g60 [Diversispora epigaea]|uniref:DNA polymerase n=1 Tax=Diversispora epigaea TaxID=1348612 RepID=A0A397IPN9_9GLOM|nr:hypothetical protein Glove_168g60 [Diversispora epigaea]